MLKLGEKIGQGAQHAVFLLDEPSSVDKSVIKISNFFGRIWDTLNFKEVSEDYNELLSSPISPIETQILDRPVLIQNSVPFVPEYALIQPFLTGRPLNETDLSCPIIADKLVETVKFSYEMFVKHSKALDLVGGEAFSRFLATPFTKKPLGVYNVFIQEDDLQLIDVKLLNLKNVLCVLRPLVDFIIHFQHESILHVMSHYQNHTPLTIHDSTFYKEFVDKLYAYVRFFRS